MKILKSLPLLLAVALISCKKDKTDTQNFPVTLYAESAQVVSETRVYIKGGEIKDAQKIAQLVKNYNSYFHAEESTSGIGSSYLTFISKDSATFYNSSSRYKVEKSGEQLLLTSSLTSISPSPIFPEQIRFHLLKHENVRTEGNGEIRKDVKIAYGNYNSLKIPVFGYLISSGLDGPVKGLSRLGGLITNEFNEAALSRLGTNDTIAVKTYTITVKAK